MRSYPMVVVGKFAWSKYVMVRNAIAEPQKNEIKQRGLDIFSAS